jgi:hypothetical protein
MDCVLFSARSALANRAPDPPAEIAPPITHKAIAAHAGHMALLLPCFRSLASAFQHVRPAALHALAMVFRDRPQC